MAATYATTGSLDLQAYFQATGSVDVTGALKKAISLAITFTESGGTEPDLAGFLSGTGSISGAVDMLLANATDPMQGAGDAIYFPPAYAPSGTGKIKFVYFKNTTAAGGGKLKIERGALNGLPIFDAAGEGLEIPAQGALMLCLYDGSVGGAITTTSNDKLTVTPSTGTVTFEMVVAYGV